MKDQIKKTDTQRNQLIQNLLDKKFANTNAIKGGTICGILCTDDGSSAEGLC